MPRLRTPCDGGWTRSGRHLAARAITGLRQIHHQAPGFSYEVVADTLLRVTGQHCLIDSWSSAASESQGIVLLWRDAEAEEFFGFTGEDWHGGAA